MNTGSRLLIVVFFVGGLVIGWGVTRFMPLPWIGVPAGSSGGDDAGGTGIEETIDGRKVAALGRLEPAGGIVAVGALPGDILKTLNVQVGDEPDQNDVLAQLASFKLRQMEVASIRAQIKEAEARETAETNLADTRILAAQLALKQAKSKSLELESQKQQVDVLRSKLELEENKLQSIAGVSRDLISEEEQKQQELLVKQLQAELSAAETQVEQYEQTSRLALRAARADLSAAKTAKEQIKATVPTASLNVAKRLAVEQRERAEIKAPISGTVLAINMDPGEHITNQPILQMANLKEMVCVAEIYETDAHLVDPQKRPEAEITSDALGKNVKLKGIVTRKSQIVGPAQLNPLDPFAPVDRHVVQVRIEIDDEDVAKAAQFVNLQVKVEITTSGSAEPVAAHETAR